MEIILQEALQYLTTEQIDFLCEEFQLSHAELMEASEEKLDEIYDVLCDIEVDETYLARNAPLSVRGQHTSDIVTILGNAIAEAEGLFDEYPFDWDDIDEEEMEE